MSSFCIRIITIFYMQILSGDTAGNSCLFFSTYYNNFCLFCFLLLIVFVNTNNNTFKLLHIISHQIVSQFHHNGNHIYRVLPMSFVSYSIQSRFLAFMDMMHFFQRYKQRHCFNSHKVCRCFCLLWH